MTLTADEIIREAELSVQLSQEVQIEKKASEAADDMINQRSMSDLEKIAEYSPLVKLAMESDEDFFQTKSFRVNSCLEKVAAPTGAVAGFMQKMMANNGARNIMVGAGIGAGTGLVFGPKDDKFGAAIKGGLLGGLGGAGVSAYKSLGLGNAATHIPDAMGARLSTVKPSLAHLGTEANAAYDKAGIKSKAMHSVFNAREAVAAGHPRVQNVVGRQIGGNTNALAERIDAARNYTSRIRRNNAVGLIREDLNKHLGKLEGVVASNPQAINAVDAARKTAKGHFWTPLTDKLYGGAGREATRASEAVGILRDSNKHLAEGGAKHIQDMSKARLSSNTNKAVAQNFMHETAPEALGNLHAQRSAMEEANTALGGAKKEMAGRASAEAAAAQKRSTTVAPGASVLFQGSGVGGLGVQRPVPVPQPIKPVVNTGLLNSGLLTTSTKKP